MIESISARNPSRRVCSWLAGCALTLSTGCATHGSRTDSLSLLSDANREFILSLMSRTNHPSLVSVVDSPSLNQLVIRVRTVSGESIVCEELVAYDLAGSHNSVQRRPLYTVLKSDVQGSWENLLRLSRTDREVHDLDMLDGVYSYVILQDGQRWTNLVRDGMEKDLRRVADLEFKPDYANKLLIRMALASRFTFSSSAFYLVDAVASFDEGCLFISAKDAE